MSTPDIIPGHKAVVDEYVAGVQAAVPGTVVTREGFGSVPITIARIDIPGTGTRVIISADTENGTQVVEI